MFSKFILAFAIVLHRAATKVRISAHVLTTDVAKDKAQKAWAVEAAAERALEAMRDSCVVARDIARQAEADADKVCAANYRAIEMLENPAL